MLDILTMEGDNIKRLLPSNPMFTNISIEGCYCSVKNVEAHVEQVTHTRSRTVIEIKAEPIEYTLSEDQRRICYLMDLANGLSHRYHFSRTDVPDTDTMLKVKRMIDTMLKSVEFVLKADPAIGGGAAELRSIPDSS